jgi:hypothetical protein
VNASEGQDGRFAFHCRGLGFENDARRVELWRGRSFQSSPEAMFYRDLIVTKMGGCLEVGVPDGI